MLRPGAALHFVEHGMAPDSDVVRWQRRVNPVNRVVAGCVLDNDVRSQLEASSLTATELDSRYEPVTPRPFGYLYEGRATA